MGQANSTETLMRLHEFGALIAYQVRYLNGVTRDISCVDISHEKSWTFNERAAEDACESLKRRGIDAWVVSIMIGFDGAWADAEAPEATN